MSTVRMTTAGGRKRDRRTVERIKREWTARAGVASKAAAVARRDARLRLLPVLVRAHAAGLSLGATAREYEARGIESPGGSRYWDATTVRNLLGYYRPFLDWRATADLLVNPLDWRTYQATVEPLIGRCLSDWLRAARDYGTVDLALLPVVPRPYEELLVRGVYLDIGGWLLHCSRLIIEGPARTADEVIAARLAGMSDNKTPRGWTAEAWAAADLW